MKELRDILDAVDTAEAGGARAAMATIIAVQGSTYRREGARLLIMGGGQMVGNISGGCLEGDIGVAADEVMRQGSPRLVTYDLTADDDLVWGLGLGCNGKIDVFVEPVDGTRLFLDRARRALDEEETLCVALVVGGTASIPAGSRLMLTGDGTVAGGVADPSAGDHLRGVMQEMLHAGRSGRRTIPTDTGVLDVFVEIVRPPVRLVVFGAGHDAIPVVAQARTLGWRVLVVDKRETYLRPERFPGAAFMRAPFDQAGGDVPIDDRTAVLVMTHNYLYDRDVLRGLLTRPGALPFYIGMLGPRTRTERILQDLAAEGVAPSAEVAARVYGPVGLDVGSEEPEEIALAGIAEILAVDRDRRAGFLRDRRGPIHASPA